MCGSEHKTVQARERQGFNGNIFDFPVFLFLTCDYAVVVLKISILGSSSRNPEYQLVIN
jgi:hypothetical protein